jgi:hypothetical protein
MATPGQATDPCTALRRSGRRLVAAVCLLGTVAVAAPPLPPVDFNAQVRPVISAKCFPCHGPDEGSRKARLRLDLRDEAVRERDGTVPVKPGDPDQSEMVRRVTTTDPDDVMPPPKTGHKISPEEAELLRRWIAQGAPYAQHWAFVKPRRPALPNLLDTSWPRNPIDRFVLARLQAAGLRPSPRAEPHALVRRLHLDLVGLPPTPEETDTFIQSATRHPESALEALVDRLLASPAYGERWARPWLDIARYADSAGLGSDPLRLNIWPWRDWVIRALNRNLPFDQFTLEQLAGDLLPNPTEEQLVATAFHRNTMTNTEGGTDDEEWRVAAVKDRVNVTVQAWMGLTMGCAQCHTHKFDPISHREYYQFFALFNQTEDSDQPDESPTLPLPTREEREQRVRFSNEVVRLEAELKPLLASVPIELAAWEQSRPPGTNWTVPQAPGVKPTTNAPAKVPNHIVKLLETPRRTDAQQRELEKWFRPYAPSTARIEAELAKAKKDLAAVKPVALPVMRELPHARQRATHVLNKGNFLDPGETVSPAVLASFHPWPTGAPTNRLGVARWLVSPDNPLTARVIVNRVWSQLFGTGLVESEEDFGTQGTFPSHPELLDWLAVEFMEPTPEVASLQGYRVTSGTTASEGAASSFNNVTNHSFDSASPRPWDLKRLITLIVTSATYQQSSRTTPELLEKDPRNRLLSRYPRRRLDAEIVRDQALAVSGLLSRKLGGPSVYPPQPEGLWRAAFNSERTYTTSTGEDRYRRGLYTIWRRTVPYPGLATFDAPSRETCTFRRLPTNTPLQAYVTLNDPVFVECAQALGRRLAREGGSTPADRIRYGLRLVLCRPAEDAGVRMLLKLYESELTHYREHEPDALKLATEPLGKLPEGLSAAEAAAWTVVSNVLLNLDGVLTKG